MKSQKRRGWEQARLDMTPMIDVVFQLLIFFVVTLKQDDILSRLEFARPAGGGDPIVAATVTVEVTNDAFALQGRKVSLQEIDRQFARLGTLCKATPIVIRCAADSPHGRLMQVLDTCAKSDLHNLNIFSM